MLHNFMAPLLNPGSTDGDDPFGALTEGPDSKLYGVTRQGGSGGRGTVYRLNKEGGGYEVLHHFAVDGNGSDLYGALRLGDDGYIYGMANSSVSPGGGSRGAAVYRLKPDGTGYETIAFVPGDGPPDQGLALPGDGFIYGTTHSISGSILRVRPDKSGFEILQ